MRRASIDGRDDLDLPAGQLIKRDADALERPLQGAIEIFLSRRWNVHAERIEFREQAFDRAVAQLLFLDFVDVVVDDMTMDVDERADKGIILVARRHRAGQAQREKCDKNEA